MLHDSLLDSVQYCIGHHGLGNCLNEAMLGDASSCFVTRKTNEPRTSRLCLCHRSSISLTSNTSVLAS